MPRKRPRIIAPAGQVGGGLRAGLAGLNPYRNALQGEGILTADNAQLVGNDQADAARRRAAVQAAYAQFGGSLPAGFKDQYGDLADPNVRDLAARNPYSDVSKIDRTFRENVANNLAARTASGVQLSGGTQLQNQDQLYQRGNSEYNAANAFLSNLANQNDQYAQASYGRVMDAAGNLTSAQKRLIDNGIIPESPVPTMAARTAAALKAKSKPKLIKAKPIGSRNMNPRGGRR